MTSVIFCCGNGTRLWAIISCTFMLEYILSNYKDIASKMIEVLTNVNS